MAMGTRNKRMETVAPTPTPGRARRILFGTFKWCRISVLLLVLVVISLGLFLNQFGLPVSFQQRIVDQALARGWDLKFSRLRLRWYRGFVVENMALSRTNAAAGPYIFVETADLEPNLDALRHFRLALDAVRLEG